MTLSKEEKKKRAAIMKELREQRADTIEATRERLKEQTAFRKQLCGVLCLGPKTVPEIAEATGLPTHEVLWQITAMKKYDLVRETGQDGYYYQYVLSKEAEA